MVDGEAGLAGLADRRVTGFRTLVPLEYNSFEEGGL